MTSDFEFYVRRLLDERQAAALADDPEAKRRHQALAASYLERARACAALENMSGGGSFPDGSLAPG